METQQQRGGPARMIAGGLLLMAVALPVSTSCGRKDQAGPTGKGAEAAEQDPAVVVQTQTAAAGTLASVAEVTGTLAGETELLLPAEANGVVRSRLVEEGTQVAKGQTLLRIDDAVLQSELRAASANLRSADASLARVQNWSRPEERLQAEQQVAVAQANYDKAKSDAERAERLYSAGTISRQQRDDALTQLRVAEANLSQAKAARDLVTTGARPEDIRAAQASRDAAAAQVGILQTQIAKTVVTAPMDGYLVEYLLEVGEMALAGSPVARMTSSGALELTVALADTQLGELQAGLPVEVQVGALGARGASPAAMPAPEGSEGGQLGQQVTAPVPIVTGTISYIAPAADPLSRLFTVKVAVPNRDGSLRSGMVATARIPVATSTGTILLPEAAVLSPRVDPHVFVVEGGAAKRRSVTTGLEAEGLVAITSGLTVGDEVIVVGQSRVTEGAPVKAEPLPPR
ncbi:MAG TPA: efflux RND transporter periplasmic adaptor subunit [bacterium]|nr:efflux RND transporter periplasmic adaptor subunit [bacterium]